jgi:hypothetical protein
MFRQLREQGTLHSYALGDALQWATRAAAALPPQTSGCNAGMHLLFTPLY